MVASTLLSRPASGWPVPARPLRDGIASSAAARQDARMHWLKAGNLHVAFSRHTTAGSARAGWAIHRFAHEHWKAGSVVAYGPGGLMETSLFFILAGRARVSGPGGVCVVGPSALVLARKGTDFRVDQIAGPALELFAMQVRGRRLQTLARQVAPAGSLVVNMSEPDRIHWIFESLLEHLMRHDPVTVDHADAWVQVLLLTMQQEREARHDRNGAADRQFQRCRALIERDFSELAGVADAATRCGLHRDYLNRLFKRFADVTVEEYLRRLRLDAASRLLLTSNRTLADIGEEVGYADEFSFSKAFKRRFGRAPRHWRQSGGGLH